MIRSSHKGVRKGSHAFNALVVLISRDESGEENRVCARSSVWIEQRFPKPLVAGSSPAGRTTKTLKFQGKTQVLNFSLLPG